jgi:hypothetical protein
VVLFVRKGVHWQERIGLKKLFRMYIMCAVPIRLTQYMMVEPYFGGITSGVSALLPFAGEADARMLVLCLQSFAMTFGISLMNMSTLSLVGAVVPSAAAGSLFAGFMSVGNLGYSMSYSTGAWLYEHGRGVATLAALDDGLFGAAGTRTTLSIGILVLANALGYILSFAAAHFLPDRAATLESHDAALAGVTRWTPLGRSRVRTLSGAFWLGGAALFALLHSAGLDPVSSFVATFFTTVFARKAVLDALLRRAR